MAEIKLAIIERETGTIPLSIGTALAFESLFGIHPDQSKHSVNTKTINEVWVNIRTLVRNLYSAVPSAKVTELDLNASVELLYSEIELFPVIMEQYKQNITVRPYVSSLIDFEYAFPKAKHKHPKTPRQISYQFFEDYVTKGLYDLLKQNKADFIEINKRPERTTKTVALLTHYPHELLWKEQFNRLLLLESHTGRIKPYNEWYTKLHNFKKEYRPIPFNKFTLQVFGDNVLIDPQNRTIKGQLLQLAESRKWSPMTTTDKFYHDITTHGPKELLETFKLLR